MSSRWEGTSGEIKGALGTASTCNVANEMVTFLEPGVRRWFPDVSSARQAQDKKAGSAPVNVDLCLPRENLVQEQGND